MAEAFRVGAPETEIGGAAAADEEEDAVLLARAKADRRAFAPLYRRYVDPVYRYCYRRLGSREAAEDATGLVFARALAALPGCRDASFRPWLFTIAHNAIVDAGRAARPERAARPLDAAGAEAVPDPTPSPEEDVLAAEARESVLGLLPKLPDDQRRVLELRLAGLTGPEVARALGRSHGGVRVAQSRAVARLRALLAEPSGEMGAADVSARQRGRRDG